MKKLDAVYQDFLKNSMQHDPVNHWTGFFQEDLFIPTDKRNNANVVLYVASLCKKVVETASKRPPRSRRGYDKSRRERGPGTHWKMTNEKSFYSTVYGQCRCALGLPGQALPASPLDPIVRACAQCKVFPLGVSYNFWSCIAMKSATVTINSHSFQRYKALLHIFHQWKYSDFCLI